MKENTLSYTTRIGKTTFIVNVKQSESANKPLNTVFQEIEDAFFALLMNRVAEANGKEVK